MDVSARAIATLGAFAGYDGGRLACVSPSGLASDEQCGVGLDERCRISSDSAVDGRTVEKKL